MVIEMTLAESAVWFAERGFAVLPSVPRGKEWLFDEGPLGATTDTALIRDWWTRFPDANVAVATGWVSNLFVLDCDFIPGGPESRLEIVERYGIPPTTEVRSPHGIHFWLKNPTGIDPMPLIVGWGIHPRGEFASAIVPPSVGRHGVPYHFGGLGRDGIPRLPEVPARLMRELEVWSKRNPQPFLRGGNLTFRNNGS